MNVTFDHTNNENNADQEIIDFATYDSFKPSKKIDLNSEYTRKFFDTVLLHNLPNVALLLIYLYFLIGISHQVLLSGPIKVYMTAFTSFSILVGIIFYLILKKKEISSQYAHPLGVGLLSIVLINSFLHLQVTQDPFQTTNFVLLIIGAGCFFLSFLWFFIIVFISCSGWILFTIQTGITQDWIHYGFLLLSSVFVAIIIMSMRVRTYRYEINIIQRLKQTQDSLNKRTQDLEVLNKNLEQEITERSIIEAKLKTLSLVASKTDNAVVITDKNGLIEWVNEGFTRITGFYFSDVISKKPGEILQGQETDPQTVKRIREKLQQKVGFTEEIVNYKKNGTSYWVSISITPIFNRRGEIERYIAVETDITEKREKERALKDSEERLRKILENVVDGIITIDEAGKIISINQAIQQIFGYTEPELIGQNINLLVPKINEDKPQEYINKDNLASQSNFSGLVCELEGINKEGENFPIDIAFSDMQYNGEHHYIGIIRDVTEREQAQSALLESEARFRGAFDNAATGMAIISTDGRFIKVNRSLSVILGYTETEFLKMDFFSITHPDDVKTDLKYIQHIIDNKITAYQLEKRYIHKHGNVIWSLISISLVRDTEGDPLYFVTQIQDITERKNYEHALQESEERLQDFLDKANDIIHSTDLFGNLIYVNRAWQETLDYTYDEISKLTIWDIIEPSFHLSYQEVLKRVLDGESVQDVELVFRAKNGRRIVVAGSTNCRFEDGLPVAIRSIFRDITERKRAAEELRKAKDAAEQANLAKSQFLANMSHELRTPLNSIIGFANILKKNKRNTLDTKDLNYVDRISNNGLHLLNLINDVLDLSKIEAGKMDLDYSMVDLAELIHEVIQQLESQKQNRQITINTDIHPSLDPIETDRGKLKQVLINLIGNALKFTHQGNVTIRIHHVPGTTQPQQIDVSDTGLGIPEDRLEAIFKAFQQADSSTTRKFGGTGLGLSISRSLCELLGYSITVQSKIQQGSTFSIMLFKQRGFEHENKYPGKQCTISKQNLKNKLVLIIDDEAEIRVVLSHQLKSMGCETITASNGKEGLILAHEHHPDIIITDLFMPGLHGWEVLRNIKEDPELKLIPVIIISGASQDNIVPPLGQVDYISKPIDSDKLMEIMQRNLRKVKKSTKIMVIEDDLFEQEMIYKLLEKEYYHVLIKNNGKEALEALDDFVPDIILLDLLMPVMDGFEFLRRLRDNQNYDHIPTIVVTAKDIEEHELHYLQKSSSDIIIKKDDLFNSLQNSLNNLNTVIDE